MMKLKQTDLPEYRADLLKKQLNCCGICNKPIEKGQEALDHDHVTGYCRGVVHMDCNILLGKIENYLNRRGKALREDKDRLKGFFYWVYYYMTADWSEEPLHPRHRTEVDKQIREYRRRLKLAKKESTKAKYRTLIRDLKDEN